MLRLRLLAIFLGIALNGCATAHFNHPLALMEDPTTQDTTWRHAAQQAQRQMPKHPDRLQVLYRLISNESAPAWRRQYAVGQLIQYDSQRLRTLLLNDVVSIDDWNTWDHLLDRVISLEWSSLTPLIVRQYARPRAFTADRDRLEFQALRSLNPKSSPQQVIQDVIGGSYPFKAASPTGPLARSDARLGTCQPLVRFQNITHLG